MGGLLFCLTGMLRFVILELAERCCMGSEALMKNIVNIVNFVRQIEPRPSRDIDLADTVKNQIEHMRMHRLTGTFLLQYDTLTDPRFIDLLRGSEFELGLWLEIVQPQVEAIGEEWRGRYPWDWFNDVGFLIGYEPAVRLRLIDEAMREFEEVFGYLPKSVGSWHMDAVSMNYMSEKYGIDAFCICRDQVGTDGYTMQGGYYNQAYYPSKNNMFSPANSPEMQIGTPVFRMLGSDPVYAYDYQVRRAEYRMEAVPTLECISNTCGGNPGWVDSYFENTFSGHGISFQYTQAGQENSFGWPRLGPGFEYQMAHIRKQLDEGRVELMTLGEAGRWFKRNYTQTPPAAYTEFEDYHNRRYKSVWYSCRRYRANVFWDDGCVKIRDMYIFSDRLKERYLDRRCVSHACEFRNLPVMDGALYGRDAGIYLTKQGENICWRDIAYRETEDGCVIALEAESGRAEIALSPEEIAVWSDIKGFELTTVVDVRAACGLSGDADATFANHNNRKTELSFVTEAEVLDKRIRFVFLGVDYGLTAKKGVILEDFRILPENGRIELAVNG